MGRLADAASSGDHRRFLEAMRDTIADEIDAGVPSRELSSLTKRLADIVSELISLNAAEGGDEIARAAKLEDEEWKF